MGTAGRRGGIDRRTWLARVAGGLAAGRGVLAVGAEAQGRGLIVRNSRPADLETPTASLDAWLTPNEVFFVRSHFGPPAEGLRGWSLAVGGLVDGPLRLGPADLLGFERVTVAAVLQCAGNGRSFFRPIVPGVGWERGAVGHAEWTGVRLADVLRKAGIKGDAAHVHCLGSDGPPSPKTPAFLRSLPMAKALHPDTILATAMNGAPLPSNHGGPVRLVVPGWGGQCWTKWLRSLTVSAAEAPGFYMQTGYRVPRRPIPPGATPAPAPADLVPVTSLNVKSLITSPAEGAVLPAGPVEIRGFAWTGEGRVDRVEVSRDGGLDGTWRPAALGGDPVARPWSWRPWKVTVAADRPGPITVAARAVDEAGASQPETTPWNKSGYLWNAVDRVTFKVG